MRKSAFAFHNSTEIARPGGTARRRALHGGIALSVLCAAFAFAGAQAADSTSSPSAAVPRLMQEPGIGWSGRIGRTGPRGPANVLTDRTANEWLPPLAGIGPITDDPAHPFYNNAVAEDLGVPSSYRIANLNNEAGKNLMPWAVEALKKQNALALAGRNGETRQARCWPTGVPDIHEAPWALYFLQTPKEVVMLLGGPGQQVRRVYLNVPHSKNPKPSWFGESVGHYEGGDTLVVDTIGLSDKSFVDGYRTPHTDRLHVVERFKIAQGGKVLDVSFTADDPGTFYKPWGARKPRYRTDAALDEQLCQLNNDDVFHEGFDPIPSANRFDF